MTDHILKQQIIPLLDLTDLNDNTTIAHIADLCNKAQMVKGPIAAVCIYPQFIKTAKEMLDGTNIKIATVSNFPHGTDPLTAILKEIDTALTAGADEIDLVLPYRAYMTGNRAEACAIINTCKKLCVNHTLKVILETGVLQDHDLIRQASQDAIDHGADFLKTSTGKVAINATLEAAAIMLETIRANKMQVGFKAAGGIRTFAQAQAYLNLATTILGIGWPTPETFRFGASSLLEDILNS